MVVLTREDLRNQLKKREIAPVYLLFGAETYLRDLAAKTIADFVFVENSLREFNENDRAAPRDSRHRCQNFRNRRERYAQRRLRNGFVGIFKASFGNFGGDFYR
jgi:hypothetical protein